MTIPASDVIYQAAGSQAVQRTAEAKLREADDLSIQDYGAIPGGAIDAVPAIQAAFQQGSGSRTYLAPNGGWWGIGTLSVPKGYYGCASPIDFGLTSQLGMEVRGDSAYASTLAFSQTEGAGLKLRTYVNVHVHDLSLRNTSTNAGTSVAIDLDGEGGGGNLTLKRLVLEGFHTAIRTKGDTPGGVATPGNGDKTVVEQTMLLTAVGYDQTRNNQAIGWTFLNCASGCSETAFKLGGAGETAIVNHVGDVYGSLIQLPEASGNPGSGNYIGSRTTVSSTKLEYHGEGDRMLIDARESLAVTDGGGTNADIVLREVSLAGGSAVPDPATHVVMQVGDDTHGSDAVRVKQEGGWIEGVIKLGSAQYGANGRRWSFRDAVRAPDPATVQFMGPGNHYLMEWRANENVPVDQYRGGQGFIGAIDATKAFLWRHSGASLLNTGVASTSIGGRVGGDFVIGGFPAGTSFTGLGVYLDQTLAGMDLQITQLASDGTTPIGATLALPAGTGKGLRQVHGVWNVSDDGNLHVRVTANVGGGAVRGAIVPFYFPYMGS